MPQMTKEAQGAVQYTVSFKKAHLHYATVQMTVPTENAEHLDFNMPVWTPGSYMVREFSQHVDRFEVVGSDAGKANVIRLNKNTWRVSTGDLDSVTVEYDVYSFTVSVRHSYVDNDYAFLHGVSTFMRVIGQEDKGILLHFEPRENWRNVEVALPKDTQDERAYMCANYDLLADSPVALGNFDIFHYESGGLPHRIVMIGDGLYEEDQIVSDFKNIGDTEVDIFGEHPSHPVYIHFIQNVKAGYGGLEHLNCQTSQIERTAYQVEERYLKFLGLVAHEQFHLWNVKRIRPVELGPFRYNEENYSEQLWVAEGITSYYDDLVLLRAGIHTEESFFEELASNINRLQNTPGRTNMSLAESSLTAWVKLYMNNENSGNSAISYYNKGMLVAMVLDLEIIKRTDGRRSMDDLLRTLYGFYKEKDRGFTTEEFWSMAEETAGSDLQDFYTHHVHTTGEIDYDHFLNYVGYKLEDSNAEKAEPSLGITTKEEKGRCLVASVNSEGTGARAGISAMDEIIALNGYRVSGDASGDIKLLKTGEEVEILIAREGRLRELRVMVERNPEVDFKLVEVEEASEDQSKLRAVWLNDR